MKLLSAHKSDALPEKLTVELFCKKRKEKPSRQDKQHNIENGCFISGVECTSTCQLQDKWRGETQNLIIGET